MNQVTEINHYSTLLFRLLGLLLLQVIKENGKSVSLLSEVRDNGARASNSLSDLTISIQLGHAAPSSQVLAVINHDEVNLSLSAESTDQLGVLSIVARLGQAAQTGGTLVEGLGTLVETFEETIVDQGLLQDLLQRLEDGHLLNLGFSGNGSFFFRHFWGEIGGIAS